MPPSARSPSIPRSRRRRPISPSTATRTRPRRPAATGRDTHPRTGRAVGPLSVPGAALAHFNLGLALRQKGYHPEALREYRLALDAGEDRRLNLQAMAEVHLLRRELGAALELYEGLVRDYPDSPKLWNERGVCLHQAGRRTEAIASYERSVGIDSSYQLAWNNLGVVRAHESSPDAAIAAFRQALGADRPLLAARLNLGLLSFQRRQFRAALEEYQQALAEQPASAVAWNGVGLVLMELRRYEDARNAFGRAVDADAGFAAAHYNLSFVLSQLGDFDGALRETRRALELEPLYVPQKFSLTIDLQYEDPTIAIAPELGAEAGGESLAGEFEFEAPVLDRLFEELAPATQPAPRVRAGRRARSRARLHRQGSARSRAGRGLPRHRSRRAARGGGGAAGRRVRQARALRRGAGALPRGPRQPRPTIPTPRWARSGRCWRWAGRPTPRRWRTSSRAVPAATSKCWWPVLASVSRSTTRSARSTASARRRRSHPGAPTCSIFRRRSAPASATAPPRSPPSTPRSSSTRRWSGCGTSSEGWRRSGTTGRRRAPRTSGRSTCCRPTAPRPSRSPSCSAAASHPARRSRC